MIASAWDLNNVYGSDAVDDSMAPQKLWDPLSFESAAALDAESGKGEGAINGKSRPKLLSALYKEVKAAFRQNLHSLIDPCDFKPRDSEGNPLISHNIEQPFDVFVHPQIGVLCDVHAHLCEAEVIGLLAGTVVSCNSPTCTKPEGEENNRASRYIMYVQQAYPCPSTVRLEDNGSTDVELDPLAELAARDAIAAAGMQVVGWYHSHPSFKAKPSAIDVFNQSQYQRLVRNPSDGLEPFVGLIISTYDKSLPTPASAHNWFYTIRYSESTRNSCEIDVPMNLTTKTLRSIRRHGDTSLKLFIDQDDQINVIKTRINAMFASKVPESVHAPDNSKDRDNPSSGSAATSDLAIDDAESSSAAVPIGAVEQAPPTSSGGGVMSKLPDTELYTMSGRRRKAPVLYEDVRATKRSKKTEAIAIAEPAIKDTRPTDAPSRTETVRCVGTIVEALMLQYPVNSLEAGVSSCKSGCDILSNISGPMQMLVVGLLSLVQYYSYNLYRVDLNERVKWKECGSKLKKLFISARRWFDYFDLPAADVDRFLTEFEGYLVGTWSKNKQLC
jgi:proteasome lid subunit RPN8/RPN11